MSQLFDELKRRNVFRVAIAYLAIAWLILQVGDVVFENIGAPDWLMQALMFLLAVGFPVAILFAWAYEMTPEGIKKEHEVDRTESITSITGRKLDFVIIAVLAIAVAFLLIDKLDSTEDTSEISSAEKSVAVLPFIAMSSGEDDEYFADGLTEEILNSLMRVPGLMVTARTSAFHFKGKEIPPIPEVAQTLGVAHVVEGSVRRDGDRLRVTAQLIRASDGFHLWSQNYDRESSDTFSLQSDVAEKIATALDVVLDDESLSRMRQAGLRNPEAFVAYQKGREIYEDAHGHLDGINMLVEANTLFEEALRLEPEFARAWEMHSDFYAHKLMDALSDDEVSEEQTALYLQRMTSDLENAIEVARDDLERLAIEHDLATLTGHWSRVRPLLDRIDHSGGCDMPSWAETTSVPFGQTDVLISIAKRQVECDPFGYSGWYRLAKGYLWAKQPDIAIEVLDAALQKVDHSLLRHQMVTSLLMKGEYDKAESYIDASVDNEDRLFQQRAQLSAIRGEREQAIRYFERVDAVSGYLEDIIPLLVQTGQQERANAIAADVDARPHGYLVLMQVPSGCRCGAPWDLELTPNFAAKLEEAGLPWPPTSPMNWPLQVKLDQE